MIFNFKRCSEKWIRHVKVADKNRLKEENSSFQRPSCQLRNETTIKWTSFF